MKDFLLISFLVVSVICLVWFLLIDAAPTLVGVIGIAGLLVSVFLNARSFIRARRNRKNP